MGHRLYDMLRLIDDLHLHCRLDKHQADAVCLTVTAVGERLEVEVFEDRHVGPSRFTGDESVEGDAAALMRLLCRYGEHADPNVIVPGMA